METTQAYYVIKMKENLTLKQRQNPHYSLRAYARDLGMHSSTLSQVICGKRGLPIKAASEVAAKLALSPKERTLFLESLYRTKTNIDDIKIDELDDRFMLDESYFKAIAEWEHYAIITLFDVKGFEPSVGEIARRLGLTEMRVDVVINNLITCGLVQHNETGTLVKSFEKVRTTEDVTSHALKLSHLETLELGKQKLEEVEVELRDFSSMTIAMDLEKLPEVKTIIREFRQKVTALLRGGNKTDVYQLGIQLYPLTKNTKN